MEDQERRQGAATPALALTDRGTAGPAQPFTNARPSKRLKAPSPFELFRNDWLNAQRGLGKTVNPASKDSWKECREAFEQLDAASRQQLQVRATAQKSQIQIQRKSLASRGPKFLGAATGDVAAQGPQSSHPSGSPALPDGNGDDKDALAMMIEDCRFRGDVGLQNLPSKPPLPKHVSCQSLRCSVVDQASGRAVQQDKHPISKEMLRERITDKNFHWCGDVSAFSEKARKIAAAETELDGSVMYPGICGELCRHANTQRTIKFHADVLAVLHRIVKEHGGGAKSVAQAGLVFAAESFDLEAGQEDVPDRILFFAIAAAAGRLAHHPAQVSLVELQPLEGRCAAGLEQHMSLCLLGCRERWGLGRV